MLGTRQEYGISAKGLLADLWGLLRACDDCGRPLLRNEFVVDGRHICGYCQASRDSEFQAARTGYESQFGAAATLMSRFTGQLLDAAIANAITFGFIAIADTIAPHDSGVFLVAVSLGVADFLLADGLPGGQSLGKRIMRIRVVHAQSGESCTLGRSFLRNATQILGILDWAFIFGRTHRRLGDRVANTVVVRLAEASRQAAGPPAAEALR